MTTLAVALVVMAGCAPRFEASGGAHAIPPSLELHPLFGSHGVLQRDSRIPVWGWDRPGQPVEVDLAGMTRKAKADEDGQWMVVFPRIEEDGPFTLTARGSATVVSEDLLLGEVWVCSGQSNMQWAMNATFDSANEIAKADFPEIRLFKVPLRASFRPWATVEGTWEICTPETVKDFSAVGYYFGRDVHESQGIPVGLIRSAWGGTPAEAWTAPDGFRRSRTLRPIWSEFYAKYGHRENGVEELRKEFQDWRQRTPGGDTGNKGEGLGWAAAEFRDDDWATAKMPAPFEQSGLNIDGSVWFRRVVDVPAAWAGREAILGLGPIDDHDTTYVNGQRIGGIGPENPSSWSTVRRYTVPAGMLKAGRNVVAVRVFDQQGAGGFAGTPEDLYLEVPGNGGRISLAGEWRMKVETKLNAGPPSPYQEGSQHAPAALYHAMIAPLAPYAMRGAIWYQGESNGNNNQAPRYEEQMKQLIWSWRKAWMNDDLSFYQVQLAPFQPDPGDANAPWAVIREAQLNVMEKVRGAGMAVITDYGDPKDIHPRRKEPVGQRLALFARALDYGEDIPYSGPIYRRMKREGDAISLSFKHTDDGLEARGGELRGFRIAGADKRFYPARAVIRGDEVVVSSPSVPEPAAVRYGWTKCPDDVNLFNGAGLPASPFRTDSWSDAEYVME